MKLLCLMIFLTFSCFTLINSTKPKDSDLKSKLDQLEIVLFRGKQILKSADEYQKDLLLYTQNWASLSVCLHSPNGISLEMRLAPGPPLNCQESVTELNNEMTFFEACFSSGKSPAGDWKDHVVQLQTIAREMVKKAKKREFQFGRDGEVLIQFVEEFQKKANMKEWRKGRFGISRTFWFMRKLNELIHYFPNKKEVCFASFSNVNTVSEQSEGRLNGEILEQAELVLLRAKLTLRSADEYQKDLLWSSKQWIKLEECLTPPREFLGATCQALLSEMNSELNFSDAFFANRQTSDWQYYLFLLCQTAKQMLKKVKEKNLNLTQKNLDKFTEDLEELQGKLNMEKWEPEAAEELFLQSRQLNDQIQFYPIKENVCFKLAIGESPPCSHRWPRG